MVWIRWIRDEDEDGEEIDKVVTSVGEITKFFKVLINCRRGNYVRTYSSRTVKALRKERCADIVSHWLSEQFRGGHGGPCTYSCRRWVRETPTLLDVTQELISLFAIIAILLKRWFHSKNLSDVNRRFKPPSTETDLQIRRNWLPCEDPEMRQGPVWHHRTWIWGGKVLGPGPPR